MTAETLYDRCIGFVEHMNPASLFRKSAALKEQREPVLAALVRTVAEALDDEKVEREREARD